LEVKFKGKSIADVLEMTVEEAKDFFAAVPAIREKMETLDRVGLGYIHVGQQATTLSGGEAQRVKLSKELSKRATGRTLYILDEPTTGLHFHDVAKLLEVLHELVDQGNTVIVIEHNLEVIKTADWIIDLGPEGGDGGGEIVAAGTPEDVVKVKRSYTGAFLKPVLAKARRSREGARTEAAE
jgi:excinuclease ABC subunit A